MSQLVCPLCGRFVSMRLFNPSKFDRDIYAVKTRGLGQKWGSKVVSKHSLLVPGNEICILIGKRCLILIRMLVETGFIKSWEVGQDWETAGVVYEAVRDIDSIMGEEYEPNIDEEEDLVGALRERLGNLIGEYEALEAEEEQRGRRKKVRH